MLYDLKNPLDRERFKRRCNALYTKGCIVDLSEKTSRSNSQNRYLHCLLGYLGIETGNDMDYVKEVFYKRTANRDLFVREKDDKLLGKVGIPTKLRRPLKRGIFTLYRQTEGLVFAGRGNLPSVS